MGLGLGLRLGLGLGLRIGLGLGLGLGVGLGLALEGHLEHAVLALIALALAAVVPLGRVDAQLIDGRLGGDAVLLLELLEGLLVRLVRGRGTGCGLG